MISSYRTPSRRSDLVITAVALIMMPLSAYTEDVLDLQSSPSHWSFSSSIWIGGINDDNLFGVAENPTEDQILRAMPAFGLNYLSRKLDIRTSHQFNSDTYSERSELNNHTARRDTSVDVNYMPTRRLSFGALVASAATDTPRDLIPEFGLEPGRARVQQDTAALSQGYRWTPNMESTVLLEYTEHEIEDFLSGNSKLASLELEFMTGPRGSTTVLIENLRHSFLADEEESNALMVGRSHQLTRQSEFEVIAGVRRINDESVPEWSASFNHRYQSGEIRARYARRNANVIGMTGLIDFEILEVAIDYLPSSQLRLSLTPSYIRTGNRIGTPVDMKRLSTGLDYEMSRSTSLTLSYDWSVQSDRGVDGPNREIYRNVMAIGVRHHFFRHSGREQEAR